MKFFAAIFLTGMLGFTGFSQSSKPKTTAMPAKKLNERAEWARADAITDSAEKIAALRTFVQNFPRSPKKKEATGLLVSLGAALGNEKLQAGAVAAAAEIFTAAAYDAAKPIPDQLFTDTLSKFPANLYFRGSREDALEIARILEEKAYAKPAQLLNIAAFYLSVENGSEAERIAENVIKLDPNSPAAYETLALASRIEFDLAASANAYARALELAPDSLVAKRGLAEMKRSLGKPNEAAELYREILAKDEANLPAQTGLILSLFDAEKREEAEAAMARSLEANAGNVILLASAAYWYAVHDEGLKAIELAQKAIAADPRFIWSHIALARGFLVQKKPVEAEKTLLAARRYGNFPTLDYEIASARLAAGYYREAAEELAKNFSVSDGVIHTYLGGRVAKESANFTELVGFERRASIFAPTAADDPENAAKLAALLELKQQMDSKDPKAEVATRAADEFVRGMDKMKVHRQIFAANELVEKNFALPKAVEIAKSAAGNIDAGLDVPTASIAVLASEIYEARSIASVRGDYVNVPDVPKKTLSAILRGRIEEISGWAAFQMNDPAEAAIHLKRAVGILPADSAWLRSSTWRLAAALEKSGNDTEALELYVRSYRQSGPNIFRHGVIERLYVRINGKTDGLENLIGPSPAPTISVEAVAQSDEAETAITSEPSAENKIDPTPENSQAPSEPTPEAAVVKSATPDGIPASIPVVTPKPMPEETEATPTPEVARPVANDEPIIEPTLTPTPDDPVVAPSPTSTPREINVVEFENLRTPTPESVKTPEARTPNTPADSKPTAVKKELFPPVVIAIPQTAVGKGKPKEPVVRTEPSPPSVNREDEPKTTPTPDEPETADETKTAKPPTKESEPVETTVAGKRETAVPVRRRLRIVEGRKDDPPVLKPCKLTVSDPSITLQIGGGGLAVIVGLDDDSNLPKIKAVSSSPEDVGVRREVITGVETRALFVVRAVSERAGIFQVRFETPCGAKEIVVNVR